MNWVLGLDLARECVASCVSRWPSKRRVEAVASEFRDVEFTIRFQPFQLYPDLPRDSRGVDKLIETLASPDVETQRFTLTTLNTLLSNQENKLKALSERLQLVWTLVTLLGSDDNEVKRQTALALASLGLLYQGRLAIGEAGAVRELSGLLVDSGETGVREACSSALLALSEVCARAPRTAHRPSLCAPACPRSRSPLSRHRAATAVQHLWRKSGSWRPW